jgi:hypothetical protein
LVPEYRLPIETSRICATAASVDISHPASRAESGAFIRLVLDFSAYLLVP